MTTHGTAHTHANIEKQPAPRTWSLISALDSFYGLMTVDDVAEVLGISKFTVYRMAQKKQLPSLVIGGSRKFDPAALAMHFRKRSPESAAAARYVKESAA
jgi:excisionase family DNA binding protein